MTAHAPVLALVHDRGPVAEDALRAALREVGPPGGGAVGAIAVRSFAEELPEALAGPAAWLWLLDGTAVPRPGALEALLAPARDGAAVVAGLVAGPDRAPCRSRAPRVSEREALVMAEAVRRGLLPIRHAPLAHALVAAQAARERGGPRPGRFGARADVEWTSRLIAGGRGWWAPASVADAPACPPVRRARPATAARLLRAGAWSASEALEAVVPIDPVDRPGGGSTA